MTKKKYIDGYDDTMLKKTINTTIGVVGLGVASSAAAGIGGTAGAITRGGTLPMMGLGLMAEAAPKSRRR